MGTSHSGLPLVLDVMTFLVISLGDESALDDLAAHLFAGGLPGNRHWLIETQGDARELRNALVDAIALVNVLDDPDRAEHIRERLALAASPSPPATWMELLDDQIMEQPLEPVVPLPLAATMRVRMAQLTSTVPLTQIPSTGFASSPQTQAEVLRSVTEAVAHVAAETQLVILPEVTVPYECVFQLKSLSESANVAILAGLTWRPVPFVKPACGSTIVRDKWFVNEAVLVVPGLVGGAQVFHIRKPRPNLEEQALAQVISNQLTTWRILPGTAWYRFDHPTWGPFGVAICSDALDAEALAKLAGRVLHLFITCYNKDIAMFEALTWVRAFELFANVVAVNDGTFGGSFAWSPQHGDGKLLASFKGGALRVVADVDLPVSSLDAAQRAGHSPHIARAMVQTWRAGTGSPTSFKSPPPHWRRRGP